LAEIEAEVAKIKADLEQALKEARAIFAAPKPN
jgi:hypothetical protein